MCEIQSYRQNIDWFKDYRFLTEEVGTIIAHSWFWRNYHRIVCRNEVETPHTSPRKSIFHLDSYAKVGLLIALRKKFPGTNSVCRKRGKSERVEEKCIENYKMKWNQGMNIKIDSQTFMLGIWSQILEKNIDKGQKRREKWFSTLVLARHNKLLLTMKKPSCSVYQKVMDGRPRDSYHSPWEGCVVIPVSLLKKFGGIRIFFFDVISSVLGYNIEYIFTNIFSFCLSDSLVYWLMWLLYC